MKVRERDLRTFPGLRRIVARLRAPDGCPWDRIQTHESLKPFLLEEACEALAALDEGDASRLAEELGDLLLEVLLHVQIAEEAGEFRLEDVIYGIASKLVRRHPHVFGEAKAETPEEVVAHWEALKREERGEEGSILAGIPRTLPALAASQALQRRAARVGFQWPQTERVLDKLSEELGELAKAESQEERRDELGDVLFVLADVARRLEVDAEEALRLANGKFQRRFGAMEELARQRGRKLSDMGLSEMEALWKEAKG